MLQSFSSFELWWLNIDSDKWEFFVNDFISGSRTNTFGRLRYIDWIKFAAIDPLVFYNDYYGKIDANGDGKLQKSEIEECYRRVLEKYPNCPGILSSFSDFLFQNSNSTKTYTHLQHIQTNTHTHTQKRRSYLVPTHFEHY